MAGKREEHELAGIEQLGLRDPAAQRVLTMVRGASVTVSTRQGGPRSGDSSPIAVNVSEQACLGSRSLALLGQGVGSLGSRGAIAVLRYDGDWAGVIVGKGGLWSGDGEGETRSMCAGSVLQSTRSVLPGNRLKVLSRHVGRTAVADDAHSCLGGTNFVQVRVRRPGWRRRDGRA
jgi:hypothetical protein